MEILRMLVGYQLPWILALIFADLIAGVARAIVTKAFNGNKVARFLQTQVQPNVLGYAIVALALKVALMYPKVTKILGKHVESTEKVLLGLVVAAISVRLATSIWGSIAAIVLHYASKKKSE